MIVTSQTGYYAFRYAIADILSRLVPKSQYKSRSRAIEKKTVDAINPIEFGAIDLDDQVLVKDFIRQGATYAYETLSFLTHGIDGRSAHPNGLLSDAQLGIVTSIPYSKALVWNEAFDYYIGATTYHEHAELITGGMIPSYNVIPQGKFGAVAFDIGAGTYQVAVAPGNTIGYTTAAIALAHLPAPASNMARIGTLTVSKSDGQFSLGATDLDASLTTVAFDSASYVVTGLCGFLWDDPVFAPNALQITINKKEWMAEDIATKLNEKIHQVISEYALFEWYRWNNQGDDAKTSFDAYQKAQSELFLTAHLRKKEILTSLPQP